MPYRQLQLLTVLLPTLLIGGFEFFRHLFLLHDLSMETGNVIITILTFLLSLLYSFWMVRIIRKNNQRLADEQAKQAVYEERERVARELHDGIAQTLFFLNIKIRQGHIEDARGAIADIDNQVRQAIFNLRLPKENDSLTKRLQEWLDQWSQMSDIEVQAEIDLPDRYFTPAEQVQLFGIVQEAFANIRKHARARHVELHLHTRQPSGWQMRITDDGRGFDQTPRSGKKYGLQMMRERAHQLGATLELKPHTDDGETGSGTELTLTAERSATNA